MNLYLISYEHTTDAVTHFVHKVAQTDHHWAWTHTAWLPHRYQEITKFMFVGIF